MDKENARLHDIIVSGAFVFTTVATCLLCVWLGCVIAYNNVTEACSKLGGFYFYDRSFECKEKNT